MAVTKVTKLNARIVTFTDDPTTADEGFQLGTLWLNTTSARAFICLANGTGAAVWNPMGGSYLSFTASVNLTAPACVSLNASGQLIYTNAGAESTARVVGFIPVSISSAAVGLVQFSGRYTYTGATFSNIGQQGFASLTDGEIAETPPSFTKGRVIKEICIFLTSTDVLIQLLPSRVY